MNYILLFNVWYKAENYKNP